MPVSIASHADGRNVANPAASDSPAEITSYTQMPSLEPWQLNLRP